jgi:hypothetical protein
MSILYTATRHKEYEIVEKVVVKKNVISILEQVEFDLQILTRHCYIYSIKKVLLYILQVDQFLDPLFLSGQFNNFSKKKKTGTHIAQGRHQLVAMKEPMDASKHQNQIFH